MSVRDTSALGTTYGPSNAPNVVPNAWFNVLQAIALAALLAEASSKSVAGSGDVTLTQAEYDALYLNLSGVLTGDRNVILPLTAGRLWIIKNGTSGAFALTVKGGTGNGVRIHQGGWMLVYTDGTDFKTLSPYYGTISLNPASIAANATGDSTFTLTGAAVGDHITMNLPASLEAGLGLAGAFVSAADTVTVRLSNSTVSPIDGAARTWSYTWLDLT